MKLHLLALALFPAVVWANAPVEQRLATGQGIASPNTALLTTMHRGYLAENPAGVMYYDGWGVSAGYAKGPVNDVEFQAGYAGNDYGIAAGQLQPGCSGCKPVLGADLGIAFQKNAAIGVRYQMENKVPTYGVGFLINQAGTHRLGLQAEKEVVEKPGYSTMRYGGGYAYVTKNTTATLEVSKQQSDDPGATDANKIMVASVGFQKRNDWLMVSINYEMRMNDTAKPNDTMWMGAGFDSQSWNFSVYVDYRQQMMAVLAAYM